MLDSQTIIPRFLVPGDLIAVVSTAFHANEQWLQAGISLLEKEGFIVQLPQQGMQAFGALAGTDSDRLAGLQASINNPEVKAIWFARGGYGSSRLLERLDFSALTQFPKWFIGFSDITVFHQVLHRLGICSLHAPVVTQLAKDIFGFHATLDLLLGKPQILTWETTFQSTVQTEGVLVGGNLSLVAHLCGNKWLRDGNNKQPKILFLEEVGEKLYHIDRMLVQLKQTDKFEHVQAVIMGDFSDISNAAIFPGDLIELIAYHSGVPVINGLQAGHCAPNLPLILGGNHQLIVKNKQASLGFSIAAR